MKIVGKNIRKRRKDAEKSQERFAEELGISVRAVSYIETGAVIPNLKTFVEIIKNLDCKAEDIIIAQLSENSINYKIHENRKVNVEENIINKYGIIALNGKDEILDIKTNLFDNIEKAKECIQLLNENDVALCHFEDVVEDFLYINSL